METAKEMTRESLPIKCLEAVILGMYPLSYVCHVLTMGLVVPLMSWVHNMMAVVSLEEASSSPDDSNFHHLELSGIRACLLGPSSV